MHCAELPSAGNSARRCIAMKYFDENKDKKMTWSAFLFDNEKGLTGGVKADATDDSCHREKDLS